MEARELAQAIVKILDDKKAMDLKLLEIGDLTVLADYFVICTGTSITHIRALSDEVEYKLKEQGTPVLHLEGYKTGGWILMDYGSVVVHIFQQETREFYGLDHMWADGKEQEIADFLIKGMDK